MTKDRRKPHVLFVRFGTRAGIIGGGVVRLLEVTKRLRERCDFSIITHITTFSWLRRLGLEASPYYLVNSKWAWTQGVASLFFCMMKTVLRFRVSKPIDVVYSFTHSLPDFIPSIWIKILTRCRLILYLQTPLLPPPHPKEGGLLGPYLHRLDHLLSILLMRQIPDLIFVFNEYDKQILITKGVSADKIKVISYGVNIKKIRQVKERNRKYDAIFLGRLATSKGVFDLIEIWRHICTAKPDSKLLMVGPGLPERMRTLRQKIEELGLSSNIILLGPLYDEEKYVALKSCKLFVNPSYVETWGITVCEAMACGCAAIAYGLPVYKSVYGDAIFTVEIGDKEAFSKKVLFVLENTRNREILVKKASSIAKKYDWNITANKEFSFLRGLLINKRALGRKKIQEIHDKSNYPPSDRIRINTIIGLVGSGKKVLDVGCHNGTLGSLLILENNEVYGVDISEEFVESARRKGIHAYVADVDDKLPFPDDFFDVVFAGEIIEHVLDVNHFLKEIRRVLSPEGYLVLTTPNLAALGRRALLLMGKNPFIHISLKKGPSHVRYFVKENLFNLLKSHGFSIDTFMSDVVNFDNSGTHFSSKIAKLFPTLGKTLVVKASKIKPKHRHTSAHELGTNNCPRGKNTIQT